MVLPESNPKQFDHNSTPIEIATLLLIEILFSKFDSSIRSRSPYSLLTRSDLCYYDFHCCSNCASVIG